ncbi:DNA polymerase III subunit beta [Spiroplasma tabanidicola]|uniref:DNA polymerase III subunit beta n=1 Tax=Spiroplasma tabanidicola TaxID=324079 RepID=A0A6I6C7F5_9MOLU|nr:DNA polymerase III subunit beta [Spiroplasma tabanidicola]QGS51369.1 DNA polymerase III subunit beta [Spiroplasma tabanidicola]
MFFKINRNYFIEELSKCNKIVDYKSSVPSYTAIFIEVEVDKISLVSTNTSVSIKTSTFVNKEGLEIKEVGSFLIRGKNFIEILKRMDDEIISINKVEKNIITLSGENSEFLLNVLDENDFSQITFNETGEFFEIDTAEFKKGLNQTIISVNEWNQKIVLQGLNFLTEESIFYITGTDGYRVSRKKIVLDRSVDEKLSANVPFKSVFEIIKVLNDKNKTKIMIHDSLITIISNNTIIQSTLLEGQFPDVKGVFPTDFNSTIYVENKAFFKLISRADIPSEENTSTVVNFILDGETIIIKSNIQQIASFEEEFKNFELRGLDNQNIYFNSKFILESLKSFETKVVEISFIDSKTPIMIASSEDLSLSQIILPMFSN